MLEASTTRWFHLLITLFEKTLLRAIPCTPKLSVGHTTKQMSHDCLCDIQICCPSVGMSRSAFGLVLTFQPRDNISECRTQKRVLSAQCSIYFNFCPFRALVCTTLDKLWPVFSIIIFAVSLVFTTLYFPICLWISVTVTETRSTGRFGELFFPQKVATTT